MSVFVIFVIFLVVVGIYCQIRAITLYWLESSYLEKLKKAMPNLRQGGWGEGAAKASELMESENIPGSSVVGGRLTDIQTFSKYPGMVALHDLGAVAAEDDAGKLRNSIPSVLVGSLLVVGLLGTLWSLKTTLTGDEIQRFVSKNGVASASSFQEALGPVVNQFGKAFEASIAGVLGTLFLIAIRTYVRAQREQFFVQLERDTVDIYLPYFVTPEQETLTQATNILRAGAEQYSRLFEDMTKATAEARESVAEVKQVSEDTFKALYSRMLPIIETFSDQGQVTGSLRAFVKLGQEFQSGADKITQIASENSKALKVTSDATKFFLKELHEKSVEQDNKIEQTNERFKSFLQIGNEMVEGNKKAFSESVKELKEANLSVTNATLFSIKEMNDEFTAQLQENAVKQTDKVESFYSNLGGEFSNALDEMSSRNNDTVSAIKNSLVLKVENVLAESSGISQSIQVSSAQNNKQLQEIINLQKSILDASGNESRVPPATAVGKEDGKSPFQRYMEDNLNEKK